MQGNLNPYVVLCKNRHLMLVSLTVTYRIYGSIQYTVYCCLAVKNVLACVCSKERHEEKKEKK